MPAGVRVFTGATGLKTAGRPLGNTVGAGGAVGVAGLRVFGGSLGKIVPARVPAGVGVFTGAIGLKTAGRIVGVTGLRIFGRSLGKIVPARMPAGVRVFAGAIGLNTMGRALGNIVRTGAAVGLIRLKITGRIVGNISRTGAAVSVGFMIFGRSLAKIVRVEVTAGTIGRNSTGMCADATLGTIVGTIVGKTGSRIAGRALGSITPTGAAPGALTRPRGKIIGAGGTKGGIVLVSPVFPRTVAVLVGLSSSVGAARGTVRTILGMRLFPSWFVVETIVAGTMLIRGGSPIHSLHHSQVTS